MFVFSCGGGRRNTPEGDISDIIKDLDSASWSERANAMERIGIISLRLNNAVPKLISALSDENAVVRRTSAEALGDLGKRDEIVKALGDVLKLESNDDVRIAAAESLANIGSDSRQVLDQLVASINDPNGWVKLYVVGALGKIGPEPGVVNALISALDEGGLIGMTAAENLKLCGKAASPAIGRLRALGYDEIANSIESDDNNKHNNK